MCKYLPRSLCKSERSIFQAIDSIAFVYIFEMKSLRILHSALSSSNIETHCNIVFEHNGARLRFAHLWWNCKQKLAESR